MPGRNVLWQFRFHLSLYLPGHLFQRQFAQLQDIVGLEEVIQCNGNFFGCIYFTRYQPVYQLIRGQVYVHYLISHLQHLIRYPLGYLYTCYRFYPVIKAFKVLYIYRADHADAGVKYVQYILPALFIFTAGYVSVCQLIYQYHFRVLIQHRLQVHFFKEFPFIKCAVACYRRQSFCQGLRFRPVMGFNEADLHIDPVFHQGMSLLQHPVSLAHPGAHTYVYLELPTLGAADKLNEVFRRGLLFVSHNNI